MRKEVVLNRFNCNFCSVDAVVVWLDKLDACVVFCDERLYGAGAFVVEDVE